jgi:hypothetical protein
MDDVIYFISGVVVGSIYRERIIQCGYYLVNWAIDSYVDAGFGIKEQKAPEIKVTGINDKYTEYYFNGERFYRLVGTGNLEPQDFYVPITSIKCDRCLEQREEEVIRRVAGYNGDFHGRVPKLSELREIFGLELSDITKIVVTNDVEEQFIIAK